MLTMRLILRAIPWIVVLVLLGVLYFQVPFGQKLPKEQVVQSTLLREVEALGKLELVRHNFKDITELERQSKEYFFKIIKFGPDSKIALVSTGSATGCLDLTRISEDDVTFGGDTVYVRLPHPELCHYQLNMEQTHIYSLETGYTVDRKEFIQEAYTLAERRIKESALQAGILQQTTDNAEHILRPLLEKLSGKKVVFTKRPDPLWLPADR